MLSLASRIQEERMEWMECLIPGSSKDLLRFSQASTIRRPLPIASNLPEPPEFMTTSLDASMNGRPTSPQEYLEFVAMDSGANCHGVGPAKPPQPQQRRVKEFSSWEQCTGSASQDASLLSKSLDFRSQPNSKKCSPRHSFSHGGHKVEPEVKPHQRSASAYNSRSSSAYNSHAHQKLPELPGDFHIKDEGPSTSPDPHLYEMDEEMDSFLDMAIGKSPSTNFKTSSQARRGLPKGTSCEKEGEFAVDGKEGEFDGRYEALPKKPVPVARRSISSKPSITPRKKKGAAPLQHEYLDLMPEGKSTGSVSNSIRNRDTGKIHEVVYRGVFLTFCIVARRVKIFIFHLWLKFMYFAYHCMCILMFYFNGSMCIELCSWILGFMLLNFVYFIYWQVHI